MAVTLEILKERLENPKQKEAISRGLEHEETIRFHCLPALDPKINRKARTKHLQFVQQIIAERSFPKYDVLLRDPHENISLANEIFVSLYRVFDGVDPVRKLTFIDPSFADEFESFSQEISLQEKWQKTAQEAMRGYHNSFIVVDMPEEPGDPMPYFYTLHLSNVIDWEFMDPKRSDELEWIIFQTEPGKLAVYDEEKYWVLEVDEDDRTKIKGDLVNNRHDLQACPVSFFWSEPISLDQPGVKKSILTSVVAKMEWHLFLQTSKKHVDTYGPWPIMSSYKPFCKYEMEHPDGSREYCDSGFLKDEEGRWIRNVDGQMGYLKGCPICSKNDLAGAGQHLRIPIPDKANNFADLSDPVKVTTVPADNLERVEMTVEKIRSRILSDVTGYVGPIINNQAINADQIAAFMAKQTEILRHIKKPLEKVERWLLSTICKLMFGQNFKSAYVDLGDEFYIAAAEALLTVYKLGKEAGWSTSLLDDLQDRYYQTKHRNNPDELERVNMIKYIEPFRHLSNEEALGLYKVNRELYPDYMLKVNFASLLNKFELENVAITEFDVESPLRDRVNKIRTALVSYIKPLPESQAGSMAPDDDPEEGGSPAEAD